MGRSHEPGFGSVGKVAVGALQEAAGTRVKNIFFRMAQPEMLCFFFFTTNVLSEFY